MFAGNVGSSNFGRCTFSGPVRAEAFEYGGPTIALRMGAPAAPDRVSGSFRIGTIVAVVIGVAIVIGVAVVTEDDELKTELDSRIVAMSEEQRRSSQTNAEHERQSRVMDKQRARSHCRLRYHQKHKKKRTNTKRRKRNPNMLFVCNLHYSF
jgi:hypothetical protein